MTPNRLGTGWGLAVLAYAVAVVVIGVLVLLEVVPSSVLLLGTLPTSLLVFSVLGLVAPSLPTLLTVVCLVAAGVGQAAFVLSVLVPRSGSEAPEA